ncbi:MAG: epoxyqueuosine reductase QueH [Candidatus Thermoplasmatota archaeon]|nr:epoxyqueuosine reductase QueH [Candidatus Thermoplasmatota archaeon]
MKLLLHTCCAPCLTYSAKVFEEEYEEITAFWFNPNIHPFKEYERRYKALEEYENKTDIDVFYLDDYSLKRFLEGAMRSDPRCKFCYELRLGKTAKIAAKRGFDHFSTTLTISPYQDHELIKEVGKRMGKEEGIKFIYRDLRDGFSEHHKLANEMGLYKQGYCGCIFSEKERYHKELSE